MSSALSWYVIIGTGLSLLACFWLIFWTNRQRQSEADIAESESHVWDENIRELNNPLPMWWLYSFIITVFFSFAYLVVYPGFGNFAGTFGWSQTDQYETGGRGRRGTLRADVRPLRRDGISPLWRRTRRRSASARACMPTTARSATDRRRAAPPVFPTSSTTTGCTAANPTQIEHAILNGRAGIMPALAAHGRATSMA